MKKILILTIIIFFVISISAYLLRTQYQTKTNKSVTNTTIQNKNIYPDTFYVDIEQIRSALELYFADHDAYPARLEELKKYFSSIPTQPDGSNFTYTRISPGKYKLSGKKSDGSIYTVSNP